MKNQKPKKVLIPLDGSDRSLQTLKYFTNYNSFKKMKTVLFHVFNSVPESYWDLEREPKSVKSIKYVKAWEYTQRQIIQKYMQEAELFLITKGFPKSKIQVKINKRKRGIARDIIKEAKDDYDLVITRRRGASRIRGITLGSVSRKIMEGLSSIPIIIAGKNPPGNKILIAVDGSESSKRSIDLVGTTLNGQGIELKMVHVIRGEINNNRYGKFKNTNDFFKNSEKRIDKVFNDYQSRLLKIGFEKTQIDCKILTGSHSRALAIAEEAKAGKYGTIIMGRRGLSRANEFIMGRVTNKVIRLAKNKSIWIVT